ncbi:MAG: hypothetical protein EDM82_01660 [Cyanobacteria bacterium CYA]|nr:MAG: hypothetical protein EDM82_01660 [Cyanobacteria bacterium CYA]
MAATDQRLCMADQRAPAPTSSSIAMIRSNVEGKAGDDAVGLECFMEGAGVLKLQCARHDERKGTGEDDGASKKAD